MCIRLAACRQPRRAWQAAAAHTAKQKGEPMSDTILELEHIEKHFGDTGVLHGVSLSVQHGEFVTLLGPSGCGKTTTLRIIAGLETPDAGRVVLRGKDVTAAPPEKRDVNTVFQNYALFPHMSVAANISYSLRLKKMPRAEIAKEVDARSWCSFSGYGARMPAELSGGQRQRVAIARAIVEPPQRAFAGRGTGWARWICSFAARCSLSSSACKNRWR